MTDFIIETDQLTKRYGDFTAVDALDLSVRRGEVFGLLGPNGAGKTTTILMLLGLTEPTSGTVRVLDYNPVREPLSVKARVGYLPDAIGFYDELTARANLAYIARLNGLSRKEADQRIETTIERVGLADVLDRPVRTYSRGMRQRLGVAELLIKQPQIIILDEPTLGLDPEAARSFLRTILEYRDEGITFLLASHLLHQVQAVCSRVGLFSEGRMVMVGTVPELAQQVLGGGYHIHLQVQGEPARLEQALRNLRGVQEVKRNGSDDFALVGMTDLRADAAAAAVASGGRLLGLDVEAPSLDDIYSRYFGEVENGTGS